MRVLRVWDEWSLYPQPVLDEFYAVFTKKDEVPTPADQSKESQAQPIKPAPATQVQGPSKPSVATDDDIDGVPIDDDDDNDDIDGVPIDKPKADEEDIDGVPMDDEDIDGVPIDDDIDGMPIDDPSVFKDLPPPVRPAIPSKWDSDSSAPIEPHRAAAPSSAPSSTSSTPQSSNTPNLSRDLLRMLEVLLMAAVWMFKVHFGGTDKSG